MWPYLTVTLKGFFYTSQTFLAKELDVCLFALAYEVDMKEALCRGCRCCTQICRQIEGEAVFRRRPCQLSAVPG